MTTISIGTKIRTLRIEHGLSPAELAEGICSEHLLMKFEAGSVTPDSNVLVGIADRMSMSLGVLTEGTPVSRLPEGEGTWEEKLARLLEQAAMHEAQQEAEQAGILYTQAASICIDYYEWERARDYAGQALKLLPESNSTMISMVHRFLAIYHFSIDDRANSDYHMEASVNVLKPKGV